MGNLVDNMKNLFSLFTLTDYVYFGLIVLLMVLLVILLYLIRSSDETLEWEEAEPSISEEQDDILSIARAIEANDEQLNIDLTSYEKEEEESSIISYDELLNHSKEKTLNYEDELATEDLTVKKINLAHIDELSEVDVADTKTRPYIISYEKEEALLAALKQLQKNLSQSH